MPAARIPGMAIPAYVFVKQWPGKRLSDRAVHLPPSNERLNNNGLGGSPQYEAASLLYTKSEYDDLVIFFAFQAVIQSHESAVIVSFCPV